MYKKFFLILILVAVVGRFIGLGYIPPHLSSDEIAAAYNAYSIEKTGRDGNNQFLPLLWLSNGGYGSPFAVYTILPSIAIFGNNDVAVRLPSAILGSLTIILVGLLIFELTSNEILSLVTSLMVAFSPWHFSASRWALESNYALFFIVLGIYLFFVGMRKGRNFLTLLSFVSFAASIYSYYTEWVLTPIIVLALLFFYRKIVLKNKIYLIGIAIFGILVAPIFVNFVSTLNGSRASSELINKDISVGRLLLSHPNPLQKFQILLKAVFDKYSAYVSFDYLFFYGARMLPKDNPYQFGFFLAPFLPAFVWGLYKLKVFFKEHSNFIYFLLFASPFTASITEGDINNWRSLPEILPIAIITAVGVVLIWEYIKKSVWTKFLVFGVLLTSFSFSLIGYIMHFRIENAEGYQYGYEQMAEYINKHYSEYEKIIIDRRFGSMVDYHIGVPSSYIPFYTYTDPRKVQSAKPTNLGVSFDKYEFRQVNWNGETVKKNYLYIVPFDNLPYLANNVREIYSISLPGGRVEFIFYSSQNP